MANVAELSVLISADPSGAERSFSAFQAKMRSFGDSLTRVGTQMSIGITAPISLMGAAVLKVGQDYEKAMNLFQVNTRATSEEMARASQVAEQLGSDMKLPATSAGDAALAMNELAKGGLTANEAMDAVRGTLELAAAAGITEAEAAMMTATALNVFGLEAAESARVTDLLAAAASASLAEISDVGLAMAQAANMFASSKVTVEDLTTSIALMAQAGIRGSDAGTSLKTMMIALSAPTEKAASEMQRLGINIFDAQGNFIPFRGMIEQVSGALKGMSEQQQAAALKTIFGTDALRAANVVLAKGTEAFDEMSEAVNRSGAAQELSAARAKGLSGAIDGLVSQLETLALQIYKAVGPALESITRTIAELVGNIGQADTAVLKAGATMAGVFAVAGPIAVGIGLIVSLLGGPLALAIAGITTAVAILAAEWVLDMDKMNRASSITAEETKQKFIDLAETVGHVMDAFSFLANTVAAMIKGLGGIMLAAFTPLLTSMYVAEYGLKAGLKRMEDQWHNLNASYERSTNAMAAAVEGRWSTMLGNLVRGMAIASSQINRAWGESQKLFEFRGKIKWDAPSTPKINTAQTEKELQNSMARIKNIAAGGGRAAGAALVEEFDKELMDRLKASAEATEFILKEVVQDMQDLADEMKILPVAKYTSDLSKATIETIQFHGAAKLAAEGVAAQGKSFAEGIGFARAWMLFMDEAQRRVKAANQKIIDTAKELQSTYEDLSRSLPDSWNTIIDSFTKGSLEAGVKIKGFAKDVINVFNDMPGKWGDAFRRTISEVDRWVNFIDSAIKLIQRILGSKDPSGLGGIFSNLIKSFQSTTDAIASTSSNIQDQMSGIADVMQYASQQSQDAFNAIGDSATNAANTIGNTAGKFASAATSVIGSIMGIVGGLSLLLGGGSAFGGGTLGKTISGALGGAALGAGLASLANFILGASVFVLGPAGLIGAAIGGLVGLFKGIFGGKSEAQKRAEQQAAQQAEFNAQQSAQNIINAAIEGFDKALRFFDNLDAFTAPRKAKFESFWTAMKRLMSGFLDLAKTWAGSSLAEAKAFAESVGPIVETVGTAVSAFDALSGYLGVPERAITKFSADLQLVLQKFIGVMEAFPRERFIKHARTFADRIQSIVSVIGAGIQSFTALADYKGIAANTFELFAADLRLAVEKMIGIADSINAGMVKEAQRFADRVGSVVTVIGTGVSSFIALKDYGKIPAAILDAFFEDLMVAINGMTAMADRLDTTLLAKASTIADASLSIFASIKAGVDALSSLKDFTGVLPEVFTAFQDGFNHAVDMLESMATRAMQFDTVAHTFESYIASGAASLSHAFTMLSQIMNAAGSFFPGGTPVTVPATGGELGATSSTSASMGPTFRAPGAASAPGTTINIGGLNFSSEDPRVQTFLRALADLLGPGTGLEAVTAQFG